MRDAHSAGERAGKPDLLTALLDTVWGPPTPQSGDAHVPAYVALPSAHTAQVVLARHHPAGVARYLTDSVGLRSPSQAALRHVAARLVLAGALRVPGFGTPVDTLSRATMVLAFHEALTEHLGNEVASVAFTIRRLSPNWKPTFAAMAPDGRVLGYGKVGWDPGSRGRVSTEAQALRGWERNPVPGLNVPGCLAHFDWNDRTIVVVSPLPAGAKRFDNRRAAPIGWLSLQLASASAAAEAGMVADAYLRLFSPEVLARPTAARAVQLFLEHHSVTRVAMGSAHGDWVPWNVATLADQLWAWDLEHAVDAAPIGIDIVHWYVLVAAHVRGSSRSSALREGGRLAAQRLAAAGLPAEHVSAVTRLGLLRLVALRREFLSWDGDAAEVAALLADALR